MENHLLEMFKMMGCKDPEGLMEDIEAFNAAAPAPGSLGTIETNKDGSMNITFNEFDMARSAIKMAQIEKSFKGRFK